MARLEIKFADRVGSYAIKETTDGFKYEDKVDAPKLSNLVYRKVFDQILKSGSARVEITSVDNHDLEKVVQERISEIDERASLPWYDR